MVVLSKVASCYRTLGLLSAENLSVLQQRLSSHRIFRKRPGELLSARSRDTLHFYFIGLGLLPIGLLMALVHVVYGPCELKDAPEDGIPPRFWQFERTVFRQWFAKHFGVSDIEHHERMLAYTTRAGILSYWRRLETRVTHLERELRDYKAWNYQPVSSNWVEYGKWLGERQRKFTEPHGYYTF